LAVHRAKRWWLPSVGKLSRPRLLGLSIAQAAGLSLAALLCGMVYNFANDEGFLAHPNATAPIQQAHLGNFIPKVSNRQVRGLLNSNTVFIDARNAHDFKSSHLQGAINIPVHADEQQRQEALAHINKDGRIVVYCQSANCKFAEKVAIRLVSDGFANVSIFKGDWQKLTIKTNK